MLSQVEECVRIMYMYSCWYQQRQETTSGIQSYSQIIQRQGLKTDYQAVQCQKKFSKTFTLYA